MFFKVYCENFFAMYYCISLKLVKVIDLSISCTAPVIIIFISAFCMDDAAVKRNKYEPGKNYLMMHAFASFIVVTLQYFFVVGVGL